LIFITPRSNVSTSAGRFSVFYIAGPSCSGSAVTAKWSIRDDTAANHTNGSQFNVMVIKP
jgi:hypothetical protein